LKRPEKMAKGTAVNTQTAMKDFDPKGTDELSLGTTRARNVDKCTGKSSERLIP
jgi:hypothetical protein